MAQRPAQKQARKASARVFAIFTPDRRSKPVYVKGGMSLSACGRGWFRPFSNLSIRLRLFSAVINMGIIIETTNLRPRGGGGEGSERARERERRGKREGETGKRRESETERETGERNGRKTRERNGTDGQKHKKQVSKKNFWVSFRMSDFFDRFVNGRSATASEG